MAMVKLIDPSGWNWDRPVATMIKVSSRGLIGADRSDFIKSAGHCFLPFIDNIKVAKDEVPVHLIALGASDFWGFNRNGDGFKSATCRERYRTFEKHARYYRNHSNKPDSPAYGYVKAAAYNEAMHRVELLPMLYATKEAADRNNAHVADREIQKLANGEDLPVSMACLTDPAYPILTRDRGYVGIGDIVVGDFVWTHKGRWRRVKQLNRRVYTGEVFEFAVNGLPLPLEVTADHPMWAKTFAGSREVHAVKAKAARYFKDRTDFESRPPSWLTADSIGVGDRFFHRPVTRYAGYGRISDSDLAAVMGYYTAEGSLGFNGDKACTVQFTCNLDDSLPRRLPLLMEKMYPDITVNIRPHNSSKVALSVEAYHTGFAQFLRKFVGRGCKHKMIPPEIFNATEEVKLAFLGAWLDGDGWLDKKGVHWSTSSIGLVLHGRDLLASIGVPSSIYKIDHSQCETSGRVNSGIEYTLNVSHLEAWRLSPYSTKTAEYPTPSQLRTKPATMQLCPDDSFALRIKSVKSRFVSDQITYNFEVEEDESYSAAGLISHNCRVSHDVCSGCGHKARTRKEYCRGTDEGGTCKRGGCFNNLTRVCDDGHVLGVDNPDPTWFDISSVFKNADRTAFGSRADWLEKAAGHSYTPGALLAEELGITAPFRLCLDEPGTNMNPRINEQLKLARALALAESDYHFTPAALSAFSPSVCPELTSAQLAMLGSPGSEKAATALSALADQRVILSFSDFANWHRQSDAIKNAGDLLPLLFTHMVESGDLEARIELNAYAMSDRGQSTSQTKLACDLAADHAMSKVSFDTRVMRAALRDESPVLKTAFWISPATVDAASRRLAENYGLYKLAALHRIAEAGDGFKLTALLAIGQNRL